jgi:hypothetical protein
MREVLVVLATAAQDMTDQRFAAGPVAALEIADGEGIQQEFGLIESQDASTGVSSTRRRGP